MQKTEGDGIVGRIIQEGMLANTDDTTDDLQAPERQEPEQQPQQTSGVAQAAKQEVGRRVGGAVAKEVAATVGSRAAVALSSPALPALLVLLLILMVLGAVLMIGFAICVSNGCMGTRAFDAQLDPASSALDRNYLDDLKCLDTEVKKKAQDKETLTPECVKAITNWTTHLTKNTEALKAKLTKTTEDQEAAKLLDEVLKVSAEAGAVTSQTDLKEARELRDKVTEALKKANENPRIQKLTALTPNAQKIADYVKQQGAAFCTQKDPSGCSRQASAILEANFSGNVRAGQSLGSRIPEAPDPTDLQKARDALADNAIPLWLIRGNGSGQHWIIVLKVDDLNNITYFDPADGELHTDPSDAPSAHTYFFGSPTDAALRGNMDERGYIFKP